VNLRPDVIFALGGPAARAVQERTSVIPIVFVGRGDPASNGAVRNIARPEGNMTGFANYFGSLGGRWLELFKEAVPRLTRVADIYFANEVYHRPEGTKGPKGAREARWSTTQVSRPETPFGPACRLKVSIDRLTLGDRRCRACAQSVTFDHLVVLHRAGVQNVRAMSHRATRI
jgi:ABC transporter substrate binding protein